jgi:predicted ATPase
MPDPVFRQFGEFMERFTRRVPGVMVLEDLHWADPSTLAWLGAWGLGRRPAPLLILGTCRDGEVEQVLDLAMTLRVLGDSGRLRMLRLGGLDAAAVSEYLLARCPRHRFPPLLAQTLQERTDGLASVVEAVVERWLERCDLRLLDGHWVLGRSVADLVAQIAPGARRLISRQIDGLDACDRRLLEAASVAGMRFSAAALAVSGSDLEKVERDLDELVRRHCFIERAGISHWPDGTIATRYAFRHALHREVLHEGIPAANRRGMHERIGLRLETAFRARAVEVRTAAQDSPTAAAL